MQYIEVKYEVFHFFNKSATKCAKVQKVQKTIDDGYQLIIIIKFLCINKLFCILLGFYCFDIGISIYLWCCPLMLVVGTAFVTLIDGTKQAGLVVVISQSHIQ